MKGENDLFTVSEMLLILLYITFIFNVISHNFLFHKVQTSDPCFEELNDPLKW